MSTDSLNPARSWRRWRRLFSAALAALASAYLGLGFYTLVFDNSISFPVDLRLRWIELGMVREGINPQQRTYPLELLPENVSAQQYVKGNYPPWSYATGFLLAPPVSWPAARVAAAGANLLAIIGIGYWAYRQGAEFGSDWGALAAASVLAAFPFCVCLSYGQYSIFVLAMIIACLELLRQRSMFAAGLALGLAAVKPQLAGLFCLVPLVYSSFTWRQKLRFLLGGAVYAIASSTLIAWWVGSTPWEMLSGPANESIKFYHLSNNPLIIWFSEWFGFSLGSKLLAVCVAVLCALLLWVIRRRNDLLAGFSICAILAMYWSYSRHYDLVLYSIPLVWLLWAALTRDSLAASAAFLAMGILLWSPIRIEMSRWASVQLALGMLSVLSLLMIASRSIDWPMSWGSAKMDRSHEFVR